MGIFSRRRDGATGIASSNTSSSMSNANGRSGAKSRNERGGGIDDDDGGVHVEQRDDVKGEKETMKKVKEDEDGNLHAGGDAKIRDVHRDSMLPSTSTSILPLRGKLHRRVVAAVAMFTCFLGVLYAGHEYVAAGVVLLQFRLFHELVRVGYAEMKETRRGRSEVPLFRTTQWAWFGVALMLSYRLDILKNTSSTLEFVTGAGLNRAGQLLVNAARKYYAVVTFVMYVLTFCATILLMRKDLYRYQIRVLSFTFLALALVVLQLKVAIYNVFSGMVWFLLPVMLILANDIFAYACGKTFGRKIFKNWEFLRLSPKKTWEGYLGGGIASLLVGWFFPLIIRGRRGLICSFRELQLAEREHLDLAELACRHDAIFTEQNCSLFFGAISLRCMPAQLHGLVLSIFASIVAPFGGFFASTIKRAYNIKDFDSVIPGHGGAMDRFDCQFIMALATYVHCVTFLPENGSAGLDEVLDSIRALSREQVKELHSHLGTVLAASPTHHTSLL